MEIKFAMTDYNNNIINISVNIATREYAIDSELSNEGDAHIINEISTKVVPIILDSKLSIVELEYLQFMEDEEIVPGFLYSTNLYLSKVYTMGAHSVLVNNEVPLLIENNEFPIAVDNGNITGLDNTLKTVATDYGYSFPYVIFENLREKEMIQGITHYPYRIKYTDVISPLVTAVKLANNIIFSYDTTAMILALHEDEPALLISELDTHMNYLMGIVDAEDQFWQIIYEVLSFYAKEGDE